MKTEEKYSENMSYREYRSPKREERERKERRKRKRDNSDVILSPPDKSLLIIVTFLVIIGLLAIFSATAPKCLREGANLASFLIKQTVYAGVGFFAMGFFARFDYKKLEKYNDKFMWVVIVLLLIHCTQEIPGHDHICRGAADSSRCIGRDPARSVGAQTAADAFQSKAAFHALPLHPMVGRLHGKPCDKAFQRLVRALTGFTVITLVHMYLTS